MIGKIFRLVKTLLKNPEKAVKYSKESVHVPLLIWMLTSIFILLPSAFAIPVEYLSNWMFILPGVIFLGFVVLGSFWIYSWAVLVVGAKITGYKEKPKEIFKLISYGFGPVLLVSLGGTVLTFLLSLLGYSFVNFLIFGATLIICFVAYLYVLAHSLKKMYGDETLFVIYFAFTLILLFLR